MRLVLTSLQSPYGEISTQARGVAPLHNDPSILSKCTVHEPVHTTMGMLLD